MANQLKMADVQAILSLDALGWSYRAIAERLGVRERAEQAPRETLVTHLAGYLGGQVGRT
jgi:hypothetical protein